MKYFTTLFLLLSLLSCLLAKDPKMINATFDKDDEQIKIYYNLPSDSDKAFKVSAFLSSTSDTTYLYKLQSTTGDVGKVTPGQGKEIIWSFKQEFPKGFEDENLMFKIKAERQSNMIYYLMGGGAALLGGIIYLTTQGDDESTNNKGSIIINVPGDM